MIELNVHAYNLLSKGFPVHYSYNLKGEITAGYGELYWCGEWEYPLVVDQDTFKIVNDQKDFFK